MEKLIKIAKRVREEVVSKCYSYYNPGTLEGCCGTASLHLMRCMRINGYKVEFVHSLYREGIREEANHCWVEWEGRIIDLTRRQFNCRSPEVFISKREKVSKIYQEAKNEFRTYKVGEAWDHISEWSYYPRELYKKLIKI